MKPLKQAPAHSDAHEREDPHVAMLSRFNHDMRSPLSVLLGVIELLGDSKSLSASEQRYLALGHEAATDLVHLADDLRQYAAIARGSIALQPSLAEVFEPARSALQAAFDEKGVTLSASPPNAPLLARCDIGQLCAVLDILARNLTANTGGGAAPLTLRGENRDGRVLLEVAPSGESFDPDTEATTVVPGQHPIPLLNAVAIIEMMNGRLAVDGGGTRLLIDLPAALPPH
jgi:signal transduction histidine kinase